VWEQLVDQPNGKTMLMSGVFLRQSLSEFGKIYSGLHLILYPTCCSLLYNGYRVFPGGKERPGRDADPSPRSSAVVKKSRAIPLLPLWAVRSVQSLSACTVELYLYSPMGRTVCTEPQCLYSRALPLLPYGSYGLYRASVPVQ